MILEKKDMCPVCGESALYVGKRDMEIFGLVNIVNGAMTLPRENIRI